MSQARQTLARTEGGEGLSTVSLPFADASAITVQFVGHRSANAPQGGSSMGAHSSANARYSAMMDLLVPRPRGWITIATVALVLLLPVALALAQDAEETIDEEALPRSRVVGQAGYAYQGEADIDGGGNLRVNRFDVGLLGRADLLERLSWTNTFFFSVNDYDFGGGGFSTGDPWETIFTMRLVTKLKYQLSEHWGVFGGGVFISAAETGADWGDSFSGGGLVGVDLPA